MRPLKPDPKAYVDAITEGRAFLDIGSGDSAVYNIGLAPASRARMVDYITCVRDLIATGEGTYDGRPQRDVLRHADGGWKVARRTIVLDANVPLDKNLSVFL